jgi:hypothetical protein
MVAVLQSAVVLCLFGVEAQANILALDIVPNPLNFGNHTSSGWSFYVRETVEVTGIGMLDEGSDGLTRLHTIGFIEDILPEEVIFSADAGPGDPLVGAAPWREHAVNGPTLLAGHTYWIVQLDEDANPLPAKDLLAFDPLFQATSSAIAFLAGGWSELPILMIPANQDTTYFGPTFRFAENGVPEPSALPVTLCALAVFLLRRYRRTDVT